jgi:hypothetical protein
MMRHTHQVIGAASAIVRDKSGTHRDATPEELEALRQAYAPALENAFVVSHETWCARYQGSPHATNTPCECGAEE